LQETLSADMEPVFNREKLLQIIKQGKQ